MKSEELDKKKFDDGEDVLDLFDLTTLKRPALETQSVSVNLPQRMVATLDRESVRLGAIHESPPHIISLLQRPSLAICT